MAIAFVVLIILTLFSNLISSSSSSSSDDGSSSSFDVRRHLSTVTRYEAVKEANNAVYAPTGIPDGCTPIHLNLLARHGTRAPTNKRIKELDQLATRLDSLLSEAKMEAHDTSLQKLPSWLFGWKSPWKGRQKGGELVSQGESELYQLGIRTRERFPELFKDKLEIHFVEVYSKDGIIRDIFRRVHFRFCLLGLFLEKSEFEQFPRDQPLDLPPKPPQKRNWVGSAIAPFAGNNMLVSLHCPGNDSNGIIAPEGDKSKYFVQVLHNEVPVPMPDTVGGDVFLSTSWQVLQTSEGMLEEQQQT